MYMYMMRYIFILFQYIWYIKLHKWCIPVKMLA